MNTTLVIVDCGSPAAAASASSQPCTGSPGATYSTPLGAARHWIVTLGGSTGRIGYTPGLEQPGAWNTGIGAGVTYLSVSKSWKVVLAYGHGFNAIRSDQKGGNALTLQIQYDLERKGGAAAGPDPSSTLPSKRPSLRPHQFGFFFITVFTSASCETSMKGPVPMALRMA
jgi:hypothetical protein